MRIRFGLRAMLLTFTLIATLLAWSWYLRDRGIRQHRAALALQDASNIVLFDYQFDAAGAFITGPTPYLPNTLLDRIFGTYTFRQIKKITLGSHFSDQHAAHLADLFSLQQLDLGNLSISDQTLEHVRQLSQLRDLNLSGTQITDAGLLRLAPLGELRNLTLSSSGVTDAGLAVLAAFSHLESLQLHGSGISNAGLSHLGHCRELRSLDLSGTRVSNEGLVHLRNLTELRELNLYGTDVTVEGLADFGPVEQLDSLLLDWEPLGICGVFDLFCKHHDQSIERALSVAGRAQVSKNGRVAALYLSEFAVTDDVVPLLSDLQQLRRLDLSGNPITDAAIPHLTKMRGLRELNIVATRITSNGAETVRRKLPGCNVME